MPGAPMHRELLGLQSSNSDRTANNLFLHIRAEKTHVVSML